MSNQKKLDLVHLRAEKYLDLPTSFVADRVWEATVLRGGKRVSVKQELANTLSGVQRVEAQVAALTSLVGQLAKGQSIDYDRIKKDTADAIKDGVVNVEVTVSEKAA